MNKHEPEAKPITIQHIKQMSKASIKFTNKST